MNSSSTAHSWRTRLRAEISWLLIVKLGALLALWFLFFAPWHRPAIDARETAEQLAPLPVQTASQPIRPEE